MYCTEQKLVLSNLRWSKEHTTRCKFLRYQLVIFRFSFWKIWKCQTNSEETVKVICLSFFLECAPQYVRNTFLHSFNEDYCLVVLSNSSLSKSEFDMCISDNSFLFERFWHRTSLCFFLPQCIDQQSPFCRDQLASCFSLLACHHTSETWIIHWFDWLMLLLLLRKK